MDKETFWKKFTEFANFVKMNIDVKNKQQVMLSKFKIISLLEKKPMMSQELFIHSDMGLSTILKYLRILKKEGIVKEDNNVYYLIWQNKKT